MDNSSVMSGSWDPASEDRRRREKCTLNVECLLYCKLCLSMSHFAQLSKCSKGCCSENHMPKWSLARQERERR